VLTRNSHKVSSPIYDIVVAIGTMGGSARGFNITNSCGSPERLHGCLGPIISGLRAPWSAGEVTDLQTRRRGRGRRRDLDRKRRPGSDNTRPKGGAMVAWWVTRPELHDSRRVDCGLAARLSRDSTNHITRYPGRLQLWHRREGEEVGVGPTSWKSESTRPWPAEATGCAPGNSERKG
jgi:hypothetical protein